MPLSKIAQKQRTLAVKANDDSGYRFDRLYDLLHWDTWIHQAAQAVLSRPGSRTDGVDGKTRDDFKDHYESQMVMLIEQLKRDEYQPLPVRRVYIPKPGGKKRPLGIPALRDRIVQEGIRMALDPTSESDFQPYSFGFRKGRCTMDAIAVLMSLCNPRKLVEFGRFAQRHASKRGRKRPETIYFLGFTLFCTHNQKGNYRVGMRTEKSRIQRSLSRLRDLMRRMRHLPVREQVINLNRVLRGHYACFGVAGNLRALQKVHRFVERYWRKMLCSRSRKGNVPWEVFQRIKERFPLQRPRLVIPYGRLQSFAVL